MKYAIDEFRVGNWERIGRPPLDTFDEWAEADKFIDRLLNFFPLRQFRIVEVPPADTEPQARP
jgi:hypothetical protein